MRVAEIISDFRSLQYYLSAVQTTPPAEDYYLEGYSILRACVAEAQSVLAAGYSHTSLHPHGDAETEKSQLKLYVYTTKEAFYDTWANGCSFRLDAVSCNRIFCNKHEPFEEIIEQNIKLTCPGSFSMPRFDGSSVSEHTCVQ